LPVPLFHRAILTSLPGLVAPRLRFRRTATAPLRAL